MLKITELRIGNLVHHNLFGDDSISSIQNSFHVTIANYSAYTPIDALRGIPITEEWLIKFGFANVKHRWFKQNLEISHLTNGKFIVPKNDMLLNILEIKFIHQLQNLCFMIMGEELTAKEITNAD